MSSLLKICDYCGTSFAPKGNQKRCSEACAKAKKLELNRQRYAANPEKVLERNRRWAKANIERKRECDRRWGKANRDKQRENYRRWRANNPEKAKERGREYSRRRYWKNPEKMREQSRQYNKDNAEKRADYQRKWRAANREKHREQARRNGQRRYERLGGRERHRRYWRFLLERDGPKCGICGEHLDPHTEEFHVDHILPASKGGTDNPDNLQLAHPSCNCRKQDRIDLDANQSKSPAPQLSLFDEASHEHNP